MIQSMLCDIQINNIVVDDTDWIDKYQTMIKYFDMDNTLEYNLETQLSINEFVTNCRNNWFIPEEYKNIDIESHLLSLCKSEIEKTRVLEELELYNKFNMSDVLIFLHYFVQTLKTNNIIWGVGRGSSVASYVLFLLGVHKINSLEYELDIGEFIRWQK